MREDAAPEKLIGRQFGRGQAVPKTFFPWREPRLEVKALTAFHQDNFGRVYVTEDGQRYPSITTVLGKQDKPELQEWINRVGEAEAERIRIRAASRGTQIHEGLEAWIDGFEPRFDTPLELQMFLKIAKVLSNTITEVIAMEIPLYCPSLKIAGRVDLVANLVGLGDTVIDAKGSDKPKRKEWITDYFLQMCFYSQSLLEVNGVDAPWLVCVMANEQEPKAQVFVEHRDDWIQKLRELSTWFHETHSDWMHNMEKIA